MSRAPYLTRVRAMPDRLAEHSGFPFDLPVVQGLDIVLRSPVTFFLGENGSGKSTVLEAIAALCGLPVSGGGKNELGARTGVDHDAPLSAVLRPSFRKRPRAGYFFRAEHIAHFAELLDARRDDPDFLGDPYQRYGGQPLHSRSHGEAFLTVMTAWMGDGLLLMDEPESALSPQRQLALLRRMAELAAAGRTQFVIASHSPVLMTFPGAELLSFDGGRIHSVALEDTPHYQITRGILECPERYWKHLSSAGTD